MLRQRCPRCRMGKIFRGAFADERAVPPLRLTLSTRRGLFSRRYVHELPHYLGDPDPPLFRGKRWLPSWHSLAIVPVATILYLPFVPAVFRYSRILWIYFDRLGDPYDASFLTAYEKTRIGEFTDPRQEKPLDRPSKPLT